MFVFFFKQKTAYEMRISDWSSDVCSSDLDLVECRRMQTPRDDLVGIAFGERRDLGAGKAFSHQETKVDRLQPRPVDQAQRPGRAGQPDQRQQQQPPSLAPARNMDEEPAVSP